MDAGRRIFISTAIGLLVKEGRLDIDAPVLSFFPEDAPPVPDENLKKMKVRHLLTMTTGHEEDSLPAFFTSNQPWTRSFLAQPVKFEPGAPAVSAAEYPGVRLEDFSAGIEYGRVWPAGKDGRHCQIRTALSAKKENGTAGRF